MKALTIKNPWALLICTGEKKIEYRSWRTNYRGRVIIHTSKIPHREINSPDGAIIGSVEIVDCIQSPEGIWEWILKNPILFDNPTRNVRGSLGFWNIPETISISVL